MLTVSAGFLEAVSAPSRMTRARLSFEVLDNRAWLDNIKQATSEDSLSRLHQVTNRVRLVSGKYASLEKDYFRLDGTFILPPEPDEDVETGWLSANMCDAAGVFEPPEGIIITCGAVYNAAGLTITFDPVANQYADSFVISVFGQNDELIFSDDVTGNPLAVYRLERNLPRMQRLELQITRWCEGFRRARVTEVDFGVIDNYGEKDLIELSIINELDPISGALPAGELRFRLENSDRRFNILNPEGLHYFLQRRQCITAELGVDIDGQVEYVPAGTYYLLEWKSDVGTMTASFIARDVLDLLAQPEDNYRRGQVGTTTAYDLAVDILTDAGILDFSVDEELRDTSLSACVPLLNHRDALQLVAVAARAHVRVTPRGTITIERSAGQSSPASSIPLANSYEAPAITLDSLIGAVDIDVMSYRTKDHTQVYKGAAAIDSHIELWVEYSTPCQGHVVEVVGGALESAEHFAYASRLGLSGTGSVEITVMASELEQVRTTHTLRSTEDFQNEQPQTMAVTNPLITDAALAFQVADWVLGQSQKRLQYECRWRQNPAVECGDYVLIEDEFGANRVALVTSQELTYAGYLEGRTRGRGGSL